MVYPFEYTRQDYLDALALEKANERQNGWVVHLFLMAGAGCVVYLNLSALRRTLEQNDPAALGAAFAVFMFLLLSYSPRIIPALTFSVRLKLGKIPREIIGAHEIEIADTYLGFSCGGTVHRVGYAGLTRVNHNDRTVLFYMQDGSVEAVPLRAFGSTAESRGRILARIETLARRSVDKPSAPAVSPGASSAIRCSPLPAWPLNASNKITFSINVREFLHCNTFHIKRQRARALTSPVKCLYLALLLLSMAGCIAGLCQWAGGGIPVGFLRVFYIIEVPGCMIGLLAWYRPARLVNFAMEQNFKLGRYPAGYWQERQVEWNQEALAYRYGLTASSVKWNLFSALLDDGVYLYLYQGDNLVLFIPKAAMDGLAENFIRTFRKNREARTCTQ